MGGSAPSHVEGELDQGALICDDFQEFRKGSFFEGPIRFIDDVKRSDVVDELWIVVEDSAQSGAPRARISAAEMDDGEEMLAARS